MVNTENYIELLSIRLKSEIIFKNLIGNTPTLPTTIYVVENTRARTEFTLTLW